LISLELKPFAKYNEKMISSMTGFGLSKSVKGNSEISIEIKGVNHRFLEISIKPNDLGNELEKFIRNAISKSIQRGKIEIRISLKTRPNIDYSIDDALLKKLIKTLRQNEELGDKINFNDVKDVPGIFNSEIVHQLNKNKIKSEFNIALKDFISSRNKEGIKIKNAFKKKISKSKALTKKILDANDKNLKRKIKLFKSKVAKLTKEFDSSRINQEITLLALKQDVSEELDRIFFHITSLEKEIVKRECSGKKIDFILQEFFREANTLAVKLDNPAQINLAIDIKLLIEEMREQTQNVE
tara:strand:- start:7 stop:900 length:894 start_codon:yes stop_codon:yes gene_type:complete